MLEIIPGPRVIAAVLREARGYLVVHGWAQGTAQNVHGARSVEFAISMAAYAQAECRFELACLLGQATTITLAQYITGEPVKNPECLVGWNDSHRRTFGEVCTVLDGCIAKLESSHVPVSA